MSIAAVAALGMLGIASSAGAVSLSLATSKSTYTVGESIVLTLTGGTTGGTASDVYVDVVWSDSSLVDGVGAVATQSAVITAFGGALPWAAGNPPCTADSCVVLHQVDGLSPEPADPAIIVGTLTLPTIGAGVLTLTAGGSIEPFEWFGIAGSTPSSVDVTIVPEPATAGMLGLGLLGLAWRRRALLATGRLARVRGEGSTEAAA